MSFLPSFQWNIFQKMVPTKSMTDVRWNWIEVCRHLLMQKYLKNKAECCSTFTSGDILVYSKCGTELTKQMHCITIDDMETPSDAYGNILLRHRGLIILVSEWPRLDRYVSSEYLNTLNQVISSNSKILWMKPCATSIIFLLNTATVLFANELIWFCTHVLLGFSIF